MACRGPNVIKPLADGSSVGVFIVTTDHAHPPQELTREDWAHDNQVAVETIFATDGNALTFRPLSGHSRH